jgi:hypothetical protein
MFVTFLDWIHPQPIDAARDYVPTVIVALSIRERKVMATAVCDIHSAIVPLRAGAASGSRIGSSARLVADSHPFFEARFACQEPHPFRVNRGRLDAAR